MMILWSMVALAGYDVVVADGPIRPGRPALLLIGGTDAEGRGVSELPALSLPGMAQVPVPEPLRRGVWSWRVTPPVGAREVVVRLGERTIRFPVEAPPPSPLQVPAVVDAVARGEPVSFRVSGASSRDELVAIAAEGQAEIVEVDGELAVRVTLDDKPFARFVPVAVVDRGLDAQPAWVGVRVRARPRVPLAAEPGARLELKVGSRTYGPFQADASGAIEGRVEQYPGETIASAVLTDPRGTLTRTELPLVTAPAPSIAAVVSGELLPGRPAPAIFLRSLAPHGGGTEAPSCKTATAALPVVPIDARTWYVPLSPPAEPVDLRVSCGVGGATADVRVPVAADVATSLTLRVFPTELSVDFPVADVSVALLDATGEPLSGHVLVRAERGTVSMSEGSSRTTRGEYDGSEARVYGRDALYAEYRAPVGGGPVEELRFAWGPQEGEARTLYVRALDRTRRPLVAEPVRVRLAGEERPLVTGADGWARSAWVVRGAEPIVLEALAGRAAARTLLLPAEGPSPTTPADPDVVASVDLSLRQGRVSVLAVEVEPGVVRAGDTAKVTVSLRDLGGQPVTDEPVTIAATEGKVGDLRAGPNGAFVTQYTPQEPLVRHEVAITATSGTLRSTTTFVVEPRPVRSALGLWIGGQTNFGAVTVPVAGAAIDLRFRSQRFGNALGVRFGASGTRVRRDAELGTGETVGLDLTMVPLVGAALLHEDFGRASVWVGGGFQLGPVWTRAEVDGNEVVWVSSISGPLVTAGVGLRVPGGQLAFELSGSWLPAPAQAFGYHGNLGGLVGGVGYRLAL